MERDRRREHGRGETPEEEVQTLIMNTSLEDSENEFEKIIEKLTALGRIARTLLRERNKGLDRYWITIGMHSHRLSPRNKSVDRVRYGNKEGFQFILQQVMIRHTHILP